MVLQSILRLCVGVYIFSVVHVKCIILGNGTHPSQGNKSSPTDNASSASRASPSDGLPDIDAALAEASATEDDFTKQVALMEAHAKQDQLASLSHLQAKKHYFERKLAEQAEESRQMSAANELLHGDVQNLVKGNEGLLREVKLVRSSNRLLRGSLSALGPKLRIANDFLIQASIVSNSDNVTELKVLEAPLPEPTLQNFMTILHAGNTKDQHAGEDDTPAVSLLAMYGKNGQVTMRTRKNDTKLDNPAQLVPVLGEGLESLAKAQNEGEVRLKAQYLAQFEVGQKKQEELMAAQAALKSRIVALQTRQGELHAAKSSVLRNNAELKQRVSGVTLFVEKVELSIADTLHKASAMAGAALKSRHLADTIAVDS